MNQTFEYVERRLEPQEEWHNKRARLNKWLFYTVEVATLLAGAAIPVVNTQDLFGPIDHRIRVEYCCF